MSRFSQQHKQSKYKILYQRVARAIQDGRFYRYTKQKQQQLLHRLEHYYQQLVRRGQWVLPTASLVFGGMSLSHAQTFTQVTTTANPFVNVDVGNYFTPSFVDIDGDGDLDAFVGESNGTVKYFQYTGSSSSPVFVTQTGTNNPLDGIDVGEYSAPNFVDITRIEGSNTFVLHHSFE